MWRYEPLPNDSKVFRARGLAYVSAFKFVDERLPGGRDAFLSTFDANARSFYEQLFVVAGDYEISPLVTLFGTLARLEKTPIESFIEDRSRWSGSSDSKGVWKPALHGATPKDVAARLHFAFNRYFPGCEAHPIEAAADHFTGELVRIPSCMNGLYAASTAGFYRGALEGAGAKRVDLAWEKPKPEGRHDGITVERLRFVASWTLCLTIAFVIAGCGHAAPRQTAMDQRIDEAVARESLDQRVAERVRALDPRAAQVGTFLHGEKAEQTDPCLAPNCGLPELEWSATLDEGCYWVIAVGGNGITSLESSLEGRGVVSASDEYCVPMTTSYRLSAKAKGHGAVSIGVYRHVKR